MQGCDFRWIYIKSCKEYSTVQNTDAALPASPVVYTLLYTHDLCATITFIMIFNMSLLHPCGQVIYSSYWFGLTPLYCTHFSSHLFSRIPERYIYLSEMWLVRDQERGRDRERKRWPHTQTHTYTHRSIAISHGLTIMEGRQPEMRQRTGCLPGASASTSLKLPGPRLGSKPLQSLNLTHSLAHTVTHTHIHTLFK